MFCIASTTKPITAAATLAVSVTRLGGLRWVSARRWDRDWPSVPGSSLAGRCPVTAAAQSTALATIQLPSPEPNGSPSPGSLLAAAACPARPMCWTCASSPPGAVLAPCPCSPSAAPTLKAPLGTGGSWSRPGHCYPVAVYHRRVYKYAVEEEFLDHSPGPASGGRGPGMSLTPSRWIAASSERLVAAGLGPPGEHAVICLLALNGLRVSEATGVGVGHLGLGRGHRPWTISRRAARVVFIRLAPCTARAIGLATSERTGGPVLLAADGRALRAGLWRARSAILGLNPGRRGAQPSGALSRPAGRTVGHPGNLGGHETWEDSGSWRHSGSTRMSCANAR
jgi:hypothetical protein